MKPISVYDWKTRKRLAYLQNAHDISYEKKINSIWTAEFRLPYSDPKNQYCSTFNLIELWDVDSEGRDLYVGLFRIQPIKDESIRIDGVVTYTLEHVITTLLDDSLIGWHEIGGSEVYTRDVIAYILDRQSNWVFRETDFNHEYLYGWQDENLLSAMFSVPKPFIEDDYYWSFDTKSYPWHISLLQASPDPITDIRYRKNLSGMLRTVDPRNLVTRLYCYGYGEGDNKLNIKNVTEDGKPYLDSPNIDKYGTISHVFTDESITNADTLLAAGKALLAKIEKPVISYSMDIQMVNKIADLTLGDRVRIVGKDIDELMVLKYVSKPNVSKFPKKGKVEFSKGTIGSLEDGISDIAQRQRIAETYAQGAESIFIDSFADNADNDDPIIVTFLVPEDAVHVNQILFSASLKPFRAYSKATKGGGGVTNTDSGEGGAVVETDSGGGGEVTAHDSDAGGDIDEPANGGVNGSNWALTTDTIPITESTNYPVNDEMSRDNEPFWQTSEYFRNTSYAQAHPDAIYADDSVPYHEEMTPVLAGPYSANHTHPFRLHTHRMEHRHLIEVGSHKHAYNLINHTHPVNVPPHNHKVKLPAHTHKINLPPHTHKINLPSHTHKINLPEHSHPIDYGMYKGPTAAAMTVFIDNVLIDQSNYDPTNINNLDLINFMEKPNGSVPRGEHTIKIVPSGGEENGLTRIEGYFQVRLFTNSRGSGQY